MKKRGEDMGMFIVEATLVCSGAERHLTAALKQ